MTHDFNKPLGLPWLFGKHESILSSCPLSLSRPLLVDPPLVLLAPLLTIDPAVPAARHSAKERRRAAASNRCNLIASNWSNFSPTSGTILRYRPECLCGWEWLYGHTDCDWKSTNVDASRGGACGNSSWKGMYGKICKCIQSFDYYSSDY